MCYDKTVLYCKVLFYKIFCYIQGCYILALPFMYVNIHKSKLHHFHLYSSNTFGFFSTACVAFLGFVPGVNLKHIQVCILPAL